MRLYALHVGIHRGTGRRVATLRAFLAAASPTLADSIAPCEPDILDALHFTLASDNPLPVFRAAVDAAERLRQDWVNVYDPETQDAVHHWLDPEVARRVDAGEYTIPETIVNEAYIQRFAEGI